MLTGTVLVGITNVGGGALVGKRVGTVTIFVGTESVGRLVTGSVVGTPLVESGVRVGCPVPVA